MDFFERQDHARRRTKALVFWFCLAVMTIILAVYVVVTFVLGGIGATPEHALGELVGPVFWEPRLFLAVTGGVLALVGFGSLYKMAVLREGGEAVARMLGGQRVDPNSDDPTQRRLLNVVEEMAIASGVPVPPVFILEREGGINAFAAGTTPGDAVVGVTRGCAQLLNRDELQGVIAHEFSHILNGDMRLNVRLIGVLHGILVLALTGWWMIRSLRFSSGDRRAGGALMGIAAVGLVLLVVGWIGVFFGRLIKSAVSRQREYLADASAVQFTRDPGGIAGALKKIGGLAGGSQVANRHAEEASHLFFGDALSRSWLAAFSTHPPLVDRIQRLEPRFDGAFPQVEALPGGPFRRVYKRQLADSGGSHSGSAGPDRGSSPPAPSVQPPLPGLPAGSTLGSASVAAVASGALAGAADRGGAEATADAAEAELARRAEALVQRIGTLSEEHVDFAQRALTALPETLRVSLRDPVEAEAFLYAVMLHPRSEVRERQLEQLRMQLGERATATFAEIARARSRLTELDVSRYRLILVDLALPALRSFSTPQYRALRENVAVLATGDVEQRLFEYTLHRILTRHLAPHFDGPEPSRVAFYSLRGVADEAATLLSALALVGTENAPGRAFLAGAQVLELPLEMVPSERCRLVDVDRSLRRLAQLAPRLKRQLVKAIAVTTAFDERVDISEAELLRATCDALDCPVPPFLPGERL